MQIRDFTLYIHWNNEYKYWLVAYCRNAYTAMRYCIFLNIFTVFAKQRWISTDQTAKCADIKAKCIKLCYVLSVFHFIQLHYLRYLKLRLEIFNLRLQTVQLSESDCSDLMWYLHSEFRLVIFLDLFAFWHLIGLPCHCKTLTIK